MNTAQGRPTPNLFILGAPKCGTTSIHQYLGEHSQVFVSAKKELHYFSREQLLANAEGPNDAYALRTIVKDAEEYLSHFKDAAEAPVVVDVSPSYLYYSEVAELLRGAHPDARAIAIVRDPVERSYSQYLHMRRAQRETLDFEAALDAESERAEARWSDMWRYVDTSRYTRNLRRYREVFGDRLLVVHAEHLSSDTDDAMTEVFGFLSIASMGITLAARNRSGEAKSRRLAAALEGPSELKTVIRRLIPKAARGRIALKLVEANTAPKEPIPDRCRSRLESEFAEEAAEMRDFLGATPPWVWAGG